MFPAALTKQGRGLFPLLKKFRGFYLAGGTALALQIGHRVSADFDLFSPKPINKTLLAEVERLFTGKKVRVSVNNRQELTAFVDDVKITFLHYPFPVLQKLSKHDGVNILGIPELAATKAYTIGRRGTFKDYADLFFILKEKYADLSEIIAIAEKKYQEDFNARLFLEQIIYLEDIRDEQIQFLRKPVLTKKQVLNFFSSAIKKLKI